MNEILEQLKKIELGLTKTRLQFLLKRTDLSKKVRKLIKAYLDSLNEVETYFYEKIKKELED